jgi:hypothetical protein
MLQLCNLLKNRSAQMKQDGPLSLLFFGAGVLCGEMLLASYFFQWHFLPREAAPKMSYAEFVSILLTGIAVILAVLALFVASLAVWGYSQFREMTKAASAEHVERMLKAGAFRDEVEALIIKHVSSQLEQGTLRTVLVERVDALIQGDAASRAATSTSSGADTDFKDEV